MKYDAQVCDWPDDGKNWQSGGENSCYFSFTTDLQGIAANVAAARTVGWQIAYRLGLQPVYLVDNANGSFGGLVRLCHSGSQRAAELLFLTVDPLEWEPLRRAMADMFGPNVPTLWQRR